MRPREPGAESTMAGLGGPEDTMADAGGIDASFRLGMIGL